MEDRERLGAGGEVRELRVLAREVPAQQVATAVDEERQVADRQAALALRDDRRKWVRCSLREKRSTIVETEYVRQVHARTSSLHTLCTVLPADQGLRSLGTWVKLT